MTGLPICDRLRATDITEVSRNGICREELVSVNRDGSEAAALIDELVGALDRITFTYMGGDWTACRRAVAEGLELLAKARGEA